MPIAFIWNSSQSPAQWCVGQFMGLIQDHVKHLGKSLEEIVNHAVR